MTAQVNYVLDTDVFIQAARAFYAFDIAPGFWSALVGHSLVGTICSIDRVKDEIERGKDELTDWACTEFVNGFQPTDIAATVSAYGDTMKWAYAQPNYMDAAKSEFADDKNADAWLIAHAVAHNAQNSGSKLIVVTQETFDANIKRRIKIPNVCKAFGVDYIDMFQLLRLLGVKLT